jgi:hypothetical protein
MDTPDAALAGDGPQTSGLYVPWAVRPPLPAMPEDTIRISHVLLRLDNLRVIGDAGPGDPRTTAVHASLEWQGTRKPAAFAFLTAPPGLYSQVSIRLEGDFLDSYVIEGEALVGGTWTPYTIHDAQEFTIHVTTNVRLSATAAAQVPLYVDAQHVVENVNFAALPDVGGTLQLDSTSPQIASVRAALAEAFGLDDTAPPL